MERDRVHQKYMSLPFFSSVLMVLFEKDDEREIKPTTRSKIRQIRTNQKWIDTQFGNVNIDNVFPHMGNAFPLLLAGNVKPDHMGRGFNFRKMPVSGLRLHPSQKGILRMLIFLRISNVLGTRNLFAYAVL